MHKNQYTICFNKDLNYELLKQKGEVDYRSVVVNLLFLTSELDIETLKNTNGITHVKLNNYKLYSNKRCN